MQSKRAGQQPGHSPLNNKMAPLQGMDQDNTDPEDYGSSGIVVNKIKSQMMTHTDKNKFNKKGNPAGTQSRNNNYSTNPMPSAFQKSCKELALAQVSRHGGSNVGVPLQPASCKEADR